MRDAKANLDRWSGRRFDAFTWIELLAVLIVLAIICAVVVPALTSVSATRQADAAARLLRDVQLARQRAVSGGVCTWFVVDASRQEYALFIEDPATPGRVHRQPMTDEATGREFVMVLDKGQWRGAAIEAVDFAGGNEIGFDNRGRPLAADGSILSADGTITISGNHTVRIAARTGLIQRIQ